jgi:hypothetical protein
MPSTKEYDLDRDGTPSGILVLKQAIFLSVLGRFPRKLETVPCFSGFK